MKVIIDIQVNQELRSCGQQIVVDQVSYVTIIQEERTHNMRFCLSQNFDELVARIGIS